MGPIATTRPSRTSSASFDVDQVGGLARATYPLLAGSADGASLRSATRTAVLRLLVHLWPT